MYSVFVRVRLRVSQPSIQPQCSRIFEPEFGHCLARVGFTKYLRYLAPATKCLITSVASKL